MLGKLLLVLVSTVVSLLAAEALFRALPDLSGIKTEDDGVAYRFNPFRPDAALPYALREGASAVHATANFQVQVDVNELGLRGPERTAPATPGQTAERPRILLLGDSFAFGWGVEYEETFGARLEQTLRTGAGPLEVWNTGVPGWSADDQLILLSQRGQELAPHLVLLAETENDPDDLRWKELQLDEDLLPTRARSTHRMVDHRGRLRTVDGVPGLAFPGEGWLRGHSYLWNALRFRLTKLYLRYRREQAAEANVGAEAVLEGRRLGELTAAELQQGLGTSAELRLLYHRHLRAAIEARARSLGAPILRLLVSFDDTRAYEPGVLEALHADCAAAGPACLDSAELFGEDERASAFYPEDGHWTPAGHARVAERLAAWLSDPARELGVGQR